MTGMRHFSTEVEAMGAVRGWLLLLLVILSMPASGCNPRVRVRRDPGPHDMGVRYYRPKPYLLITPNDEHNTRLDDKGKPVEQTVFASDQSVKIELQYLPDFSEEYSINVRPGLGTANVSFKLANGWMLTEMNQELDSQFDENISAVADLVKAAAPGGIIPTGDPGAKGADLEPTVTRRWVVRATNVPLGYYEAVVNDGPDGKKHLYGWRYVGFAPFGSCPLTVCGQMTASCHDDPAGPIYGLGFEHGVMVFKPLNSMVQPDIRRVTEPYGQVEVREAIPVGHVPLNEQTLAAAERSLAENVRRALQQRDYQVKVETILDSVYGQVGITVRIHSAASLDASQQASVTAVAAAEIQAFLQQSGWTVSDEPLITVLEAD